MNILKFAFFSLLLASTSIQATHVAICSQDRKQCLLKVESIDPVYVIIPSKSQFFGFWDDLYEDCFDEVDYFWEESFGMPYMDWRNIYIKVCPDCQEKESVDGEP